MIEQIVYLILSIAISIIVLKYVAQFLAGEFETKSAIIIALIIGIMQFILSLIPYDIIGIISFFATILVGFFAVKYYYFLDGETAIKITVIWLAFNFIIGLPILFIIRYLFYLL